MSRIVHFAAIGITALGLLFSIISTATKYWLETEVNAGFVTFKGNSGIWGDTNSDKIRAVQAFSILAVLAFVAALASILLMFKKSMFSMIYLLTIAGAAFCELIAMSIYTDLFRESTGGGISFGWSFALGWVAFVFALIGIGCGVFIKKMGGGEN